MKVPTLTEYLYKQDVIRSIAFAKSNAKAGIITQEELDKLEGGRREVEKECETGKFTISSVEPSVSFGVIGCYHSDSPLLVTWRGPRRLSKASTGVLLAVIL
ncbi:hypothetical protein J3E68DRAFT_390506 [Trichoderma sp. SZMC 28012]